MANLIEELNKIKKYSSIYQDFILNENKLIEFLNNHGLLALELIGKKYESATIDNPLKFARNKLVTIIREGEVTKESFEKIKTDILSETKKDNFPNYSLFNIAYPLLSVYNNLLIEEVLSLLCNKLIKGLKLSEFVKKPGHIIDFGGEDGLGSYVVSLSIFNDTHKTRFTAKQFFLRIGWTGVLCQFYDAYNNIIIDSKKIQTDGDLVKNVITFLKPHTPELLQDISSKLTNRSLGIKGIRVFKLSFGRKEFNKEEIQYCIDNCIAVMHSATPAKGKNRVTQFNNFKYANIGDVFYATWGNEQILFIGQFTDRNIKDYQYLKKSNGWKQRKFKLLYSCDFNSEFTGTKHWWSPSENSTFVVIPKEHYEIANKTIFKPFFKVTLDNTMQVLSPKKKGNIGANMDIHIIDKDVNPSLDVKILSQEFARLIANLKSKKGQFLGVFGRWGRGKTYFMDQIFEQLKNTKGDSFNKKNFQPIIFNAWKYQDTKAIWAYIYESLKDEYLQLAGKSKRKRWILTFKLNTNRKGYLPIIIPTLLIILNIVWITLISSELKWDIFTVLINSLGLFSLVQLYRLYRKNTGKVKSVVREYSKIPGYESELGILAEIESEIKNLLETWFSLRTKDPNGSFKLFNPIFIKWPRDYDRILFFVDDVDRCSEDRIISIIDSLRVMLENDAIVEKIVVVAAVDEIILERAIQWKYKDLFSYPNQNDKSTRNEKTLTREYMDKLFIGGIKLPILKDLEQYKILENYVLEADILEQDEDEVFNSNSLDELLTSDISYPGEEIKNTSQFKFSSQKESDLFEFGTEYFITKKELEYLNEQFTIAKNINITPRKLRIYINRYLLAKNIAASYLYNQTGNSKLDQNYCFCLIQFISIKTKDLDAELDMSKHNKLQINPQLKKFTVKLIDIVVPY